MTPIGHCFVSRNDWHDWLAVNSDMDPAADYDLWCEQIDNFANEIAKNGGRLTKINVQPAEFSAWLKANQRNVDASARAAFAASRMGGVANETDG